MKRIAATLLALLALAGCSQMQAGSGWTTLLDGRNLDNGTTTADVRDTKHMGGVLALQHGADAVNNTGVVKFRKFEIRPLAAAGAPKPSY